MLIRMLVGLSGSAYCLGPNDEHDFPHDEAMRLVEAGFAVPVSEQKIERAVAVPATERRGRKMRNVVHANGDGATG